MWLEKKQHGQLAGAEPVLVLGVQLRVQLLGWMPFSHVSHVSIQSLGGSEDEDGREGGSGWEGGGCGQGRLTSACFRMPRRMSPADGGDIGTVGWDRERRDGARGVKGQGECVVRGGLESTLRGIGGPGKRKGVGLPDSKFPQEKKRTVK